MYIYVIYNFETGHYKIGKSKNPEQRLKQLQTGNSVELEIHRTIRTDKADVLEQTLHNRFSGKRLSGEWFKLNPYDLQIVDQYAVDPKYCSVDSTEYGSEGEDFYIPKKPDWEGWNK